MAHKKSYDFTANHVNVASLRYVSLSKDTKQFLAVYLDIANVLRHL